jgi:hypothetical protein
MRQELFGMRRTNGDWLALELEGQPRKRGHSDNEERGEPGDEV